MSRLTRFLDWLDEAAAGFIRLAYLLAGITAVALYFGAGHLPAFVADPLNGVLPWALAAAVETHTYITARRVRAAWQERNRAALQVNLAILAGLLAFSAWNQLNYLADTWQPPVGALALPSWLAYLVRALVVPAAFMAAAFLAPMAEPITAQIEAEARATLADVFKIARKQRRRMLRDAERDGRDMTGALVALVGDPETRRIISHAYGAIGAPVQPVSVPSATLPAAVVAASPAPSQARTGASTGPSERPPTGGGTPQQKQPAATGVITPVPNVVRMARPSRRRPAARNRVSVEARARRAYRPGMSASELARTAHIGKSAASKYRSLFAAEEASTGDQQAQ